MIIRKKLPGLLALIFVLYISSAFIWKKEKDPLHKKIFITQVTEFRDGKPKPKSEEDELEFKDGKLFSTFAEKKLSFGKWMKYEIKKDSTYNDEGMEKRYFEVVSIVTNENDETLYINLKIDDYDIEGTMKLTKSDKPKKYFEFAGKEKVKKK